jgi:hypothetical protein
MKYFMTGASLEEAWPLIQNYHYSRRLPSNVQHCYGVREAGGLFGDFGPLTAVAAFSIPPTRWTEEVIELSRLVRHPSYERPLSSLISFACAQLKKQGWVLAVSFADWTQEHHGGIYQASNWFYAGKRQRAMDGVMIDGVFRPGRSCNSIHGTRSPDKLRSLLPDRQIEPHFDEGKHLYWKPLAVAGRSRAKRLGLQCLPYPKPSATCPVDERVPARLSKVQPLEVAP